MRVELRPVIAAPISGQSIVTEQSVVAEWHALPDSEQLLRLAGRDATFLREAGRQPPAP